MINKSHIAEFETIVSQYQTMVFRTAMGFVHSKEDAEDVTQDVFLRAYRSWNTFRGDAEISTWLYRITINLSLNFLEQQKRRNLFQMAGDAFNNIFNRENNEKSPHELLEDSELNQVIQDAIDTLPEKQRIAFVLSKYEDMSQREIAIIMETTEGAVEQLLQRAKSNLHKKLSKTIGKN